MNHACSHVRQLLSSRYFSHYSQRRTRWEKCFHGISDKMSNKWKHFIDAVMTMEGKRFLPSPYFFLIKLSECIQSLIQSCTVVNNLKTYGHFYKFFFFFLKYLGRRLLHILKSRYGVCSVNVIFILKDWDSSQRSLGNIVESCEEVIRKDKRILDICKRSVFEIFAVTLEH